MLIVSRYRMGFEEGYAAHKYRDYSLAEVNRRGQSYRLGFTDGWEAASRDKLKQFSL